jgi:glucuronokinase
MEKSMSTTVGADEAPVPTGRPHPYDAPVTTGRSAVASCSARAALAGNPSDGYGGAVVAVPVDDLRATASATEADRFAVRVGDPDLERLLTATADAFRDDVGGLPRVTLSASTVIPRSVGLGGSSAIVIAALRALGAWTERRWETIQLAELALAVERDRLGIEAGLQDRLVQAAGRPVAMTFDPVGYEPLDVDNLPLFVAWSTDATAPSGTVHRSLRRRHDGGDERVVDGMAALAQQAHIAALAIRARDLAELGRTMNRSFDLRRQMVSVDPNQIELVEIGRQAGAAVNSAGSGGSVVGLAPNNRLGAIERAYGAARCGFLVIE